MIMSNVKLVKLNTGEELIGTVTENLEGNFMTMKDIVMMAMVEPNKIGFMNYMPYADLKGGLNINKAYVIFVVPVQEKLELEYRNMTNKLVVAKGPNETAAVVAAAGNQLKLAR